MSNKNYLLILFFTACCFFLIFLPTGQMPSDTQYSIATATAITRGKISLEPSLGLPDLKAGREERFYSKFGVGYALLFVPAVYVAEGISSFVSCRTDYMVRFLCGLTNTLLAAVILVLFMHIFLKLGYQRHTALISVFSIAAGSILLPYSKINHAEIPSTVLVLLFISLYISCNKLTSKYGFFFGIILSALILLRMGNAVYSAVIFFSGLALVFKRRYSAGGFTSFLLTPLITMIFLILFNLHRFGNPFNSGYGAEQSLFTTPLFAGLTGLLFSPSKSLFLFSPLVILALFGIGSVWQRSAKLTRVSLWMIAGNLLFYAKWHDWHGGWSWGPRLIVPSILLFHLFLPGFICSMRSSRLGKSAFAIILTISIIINILGAMVWYQQIYYFHRDYWNIRNSHLVVASKLFVHKMTHSDESYSCQEFGIDCTGDVYTRLWQPLLGNDSLQFADFELFQGYSVFWSGLYRLYRIPFLWLLPFFLGIMVLGGCIILWRSNQQNQSGTA